MTPRHGDVDPETGKRFSLQRSGFCQTGHHRNCKWHPRYQTPSVVIVCVCDCHHKRVMVPKGPAASSPRIVPKK